ncbi:zinc finger, C2H2 type [Cooperia oncophora]
MFRIGSETGKENRHVCVTCGFSANNRKALYRHGVKTKHVLRQSNLSGSLVCALCPFRTNKMFNYNRHLKRFHKEALQCSPSAA